MLIALALMAFFAWRTETRSLRQKSASRTAVDAQSSTTRSDATPDRIAMDAIAKTAEGGNASADQACNRDYKSVLRDYRAQLRPARNPNEAIDRLLLGSLSMDPTALMSDAVGDEYQATSKRWPNDVELAWLAFDACNATCDRNTAMQRLLLADPGNAAAWVSAMSAARSDRDEAGFAYALQRAANAKIYDSRMGVVFLHARTLLAHIPIPDSCRTPQALASLRQELGREPTDDDRIDAMATSLDYAISIPSFSGIAACFSKTASLPEAQRQPCIDVLSKIARGDSLVEQVIATAGLLQVETDSIRLVQWRERYRRLKWLQTLHLDNPLPEHYATRMWSQGEVNTMQALAMERGLWPPPPDWLPDDPRARALITGEPPPP